MPRTLPAELTTAMDSGIYEPYIRVLIDDDATDTGAVTLTPLAFKIEDTQATIKIEYTEESDLSYFRIVRGAVINGSPVTISTIWFTTTHIEYDGKYLTLTGEALIRDYLVVAADSDYETVIDEACAGLDTTITPSYEGAAAWISYQFFPDGRQIVLSPRKKLFTLLRQKFLVFATEDGWDGALNNMFFFVATESRATDYTIIDPLFVQVLHNETRRLISRTEAGTVESNGNADAIIHNLGYIEAAASQPTNAINTLVGSRSRNFPVHLKYRTGDKVTIKRDDDTTIGTVRIKVTEVLDLKATPSWYQILEVLQWFGTTEGGSMPSTIEAAAPYTPLVTGNFDGILSEDDNNLQAAMDTLDDHSHDETYQPLDADLTAIAALSPSNDDIIQRKAGAWTNRTLTQLIADLTEGITDLIGVSIVAGDGILVNFDDPTDGLAIAVSDGYIGALIDDYMLRTQGGWLPFPNTWTRTGNHTFTVSGNETSVFGKGTKVRYQDGGGIEYGRVLSSSHAAGTTTVNLIPNSDYAMAAATITDKYISYVESPEGFPDGFNFTSTISATTGSITTASVNQAKWYVKGKMIQGTIDLTVTTNGTGAGILQASLPFTPATNTLAGTGRNITSGAMIQVFGSTGVGAQARMVTSVNAYPVASGDTIRMMFWSEF